MVITTHRHVNERAQVILIVDLERSEHDHLTKDLWVWSLEILLKCSKPAGIPAYIGPSYSRLYNVKVHDGIIIS